LGWISAQTPPGTHKEKKEKKIICLRWISAQMPLGTLKKKEEKEKIKRKRRKIAVSA